MKIGPVRIKSRELAMLYPIAQKNGTRICDEVNNAVRFYTSYFENYEKKKKEKSEFLNDGWILNTLRFIWLFLIIRILCSFGFSVFFIFVLLFSLALIFECLEVWDVLHIYK